MHYRRALLAAAAQLSETFTEADLAVQAAKSFPEVCSLKGYSGVPDSYAVRWQLTCGSRSLVAKGYLARVPGGFQLTEQGKRGAEAGAEQLCCQARKEHIGRLLHIVSSKAYRRWREGSASMVVEADVCEAFKSVSQFKLLRAVKASLLYLADRTAVQPVECSTGASVSAEQVQSVAQFVAWCEQKFPRVFERKA